MTIPVTAVRMGVNDQPSWEKAVEYARTLPWHTWIHRLSNGKWGVWA